MMYMLSLFARLRIRFPNPSVVVRVFADLDIPSLGCAAIVGEAEMVRFLLRARADPMVKSSRGVPVKDMARSDEIRMAMDAHLERGGITYPDSMEVPSPSETSHLQINMNFSRENSLVKMEL